MLHTGTALLSVIIVGIRVASASVTGSAIESYTVKFVSPFLRKRCLDVQSNDEAPVTLRLFVSLR